MDILNLTVLSKNTKICRHPCFPDHAVLMHNGVAIALMEPVLAEDDEPWRDTESNPVGTISDGHDLN